MQSVEDNDEYGVAIEALRAELSAADEKVANLIVQFRADILEAVERGIAGARQP